MSGNETGHPAQTKPEASQHTAVWGPAWHTSQQARLLSDLAHKQSGSIAAVHGEAIKARVSEVEALMPALLSPAATHALNEYVQDAWQRWILFLDVLRERGNSYVSREKEGFKPVLAFAYDMIVSDL